MFLPLVKIFFPKFVQSSESLLWFRWKSLWHSLTSYNLFLCHFKVNFLYCHVWWVSNYFLTKYPWADLFLCTFFNTFLNDLLVLKIFLCLCIHLFFSIQINSLPHVSSFFFSEHCIYSWCDVADYLQKAEMSNCQHMSLGSLQKVSLQPLNSHPAAALPIAVAARVSARGSRHSTLPPPPTPSLLSASCLAPRCEIEQHGTVHSAREANGVGSCHGTSNWRWGWDTCVHWCCAVGKHSYAVQRGDESTCVPWGSMEVGSTWVPGATVQHLGLLLMWSLQHLAPTDAESQTIKDLDRPDLK